MPFAQPFPVQLRQRSEQSSQFQFRMDGGASFRCAPLAFEGAGVLCSICEPISEVENRSDFGDV